MPNMRLEKRQVALDTGLTIEDSTLAALRRSSAFAAA